MLNDLPRPIVIAHRGASAHAPENTLAAFELALRQGADAVELDVKLSRDQQPVVIHDQTVDRTTDGKGRVSDLTLAELRRLDAGSHFDVAYQGEPIPTLEEVLRAIGQLTIINIELTNYQSPDDALPEKTAALVKRYKLARRVIFSSFNINNLRRINRLLPEAPIGLLADPGMKGAWKRSWIGRLLIRYQALHPWHRDLTPHLLATCKRQDRLVFTYTVNEDKDLERVLDLGVDGVFTDDPQRALQLRSLALRNTARKEA
jgi:glycerophosphoryl diester phosphodiesterase